MQHHIRPPRRRGEQCRMRIASLAAALPLLLPLLLLAASAPRPARAARQLQQAPGSFADIANLGDAYNAYYGDPWGTSGGYYDPYGPGYVPGFINVDVSAEYGKHFDFGPVAVDLTEDFAGFAVGAAIGAGVARDGGGFNVQLGNGNLLDLSVTRDAGFGLWLLNGLVNVNIGPDGRWNVAPAAAAGNRKFPGTALQGAPGVAISSVQGVGAAGGEPGREAAVQGIAEPAAAAEGAALQQQQQQPQLDQQLDQQLEPQALMQQQQAAALAAEQQRLAAMYASQQQQQQQPGLVQVASIQQPSLEQQQQQQQPQQQAQQQQTQQQQQQQQPAAAGRRPCEGGVIARVEAAPNGGQRYRCKYRPGAGPARGGSGNGGSGAGVAA